jgi:HSP20 family protein
LFISYFVLEIGGTPMTPRDRPFGPLEQTLRQLNDQLDQVTGRWPSWNGDAFGEFGPHAMALDVAESDSTFVVTADIPGFDRDEIDVRANGQTLFIDASREATAESDEETYLRRERERYSLSRSVRLPESIDSDGVEASLQNGVLTTTIPKAAPDSEETHVEITEPAA